MNCKICENKTYYIFTSIKDDLGFCESGYNFNKCDVCDYYFIFPTPDKTKISKYYNDHPILTDRDNLERNVQNYLDKKNNLSKSKIYKIKSILNNEIIKSKKNKIHRDRLDFLDIGCNSGILMHFLKENFNANVTGIELNKNAIEIGKKYLKLNNFYNYTEELENKNKKFDVITLIDVIEHVSDPIKMLNDIKKLLKDDGIILLRLPCIDGWLFNRNKPEYWKWVYAPYHLSLFSRQSIKKLAEKCDLKQEILNDELMNLSSEIIYTRFTLEFKFLKKPFLSKFTYYFAKIAEKLKIFKNNNKSTETIFVILKK